MHSFWTLIYPVSLLAGDSVRDLLITTQWSSNPADLIDSVCCLGLTALPIPTSVLFFSASSPLLPVRSFSFFAHKALDMHDGQGAP